MPRLLSSYAANKRVEDGLRRKQEQIRQDYVRATHRYIDETEKLVDDLIQINVRTPSAFQASCPSSANSTSHHRKNQNAYLGLQQNQQTQLHSSSFLNTPHANNNPQHLFSQQNVLNHLQNSSQQYGGSSEQLALLRSRFRGGNVPSDGNTDDGTSISKKEIPLPIVKVHGKDVFYQYENQRSNWKKVEPTYRTKVLLNRNDTVANALKQYALQKAQNLAINNNGISGNNNNNNLLDPNSVRKNSVMSRRDSDMRRASIFSSTRRGSRRDSRFSEFDEDGDVHIPPIVELKPQLSPGHTPRMLDGWTIMNWCLWKKKEKKPVWASKRYMEKKSRELKRFQASRAAAANNNKNDLPAKPSSANPSAREARRKESLMVENTAQQTGRAKSVPIHKLSMAIEEEDDEEIEGHFPEADRGQLRPTTSILRLRRDTDVASAAALVDENRPKTTQTHRRVALDTYTDNENNSARIATDRLPRVNNIKEKKHTHFESDTTDIVETPRYSRSKSGSMEAKSVTIREPPPLLKQNVDGDDDDLESVSDDLCCSSNSIVVVKDTDIHYGHRNRIPGLAATQITVADEPPSSQDGPSKSVNNSNSSSGLAKRNSMTLTPLVSLVKTPHKMNYTAVHATPVFPRMQAVVPELGSDSPH